MNKWKKHILILFAAILLNICGRYLALSLELPAYLNLCGTILAAYLAGPLSGAAAAAAMG